MKVTSPVLFAAIRAEDNDDSLHVSQMDFSVRAPFGIMVNRVALYGYVNSIATTAGLQIVAGVYKDNEDPPIAFPNLDTTQADFVSLNTDFIAAGSLSFSNIDGTAVDGGPQPIHNLMGQFIYDNAVPEARPITTRPMTFYFQQFTETGISAQVYSVAMLMQYQTVELTDEELVMEVASR